MNPQPFKLTGFYDSSCAKLGQWRLPVNGHVASILCCWVDWRNNEPHSPVWFPLETAERESDPHTALAPTNPICFTPLFLSVSYRETASTQAFFRVHLFTMIYRKLKSWELSCTDKMPSLTAWPSSTLSELDSISSHVHFVATVADR